MLYIDKVRSPHVSPALRVCTAPARFSSRCGALRGQQQQLLTSLFSQHRPKQLEKLPLNRGIGQNLQYLVRDEGETHVHCKARVRDVVVHTWRVQWLAGSVWRLSAPPFLWATRSWQENPCSRSSTRDLRARSGEGECEICTDFLSILASEHSLMLSVTTGES